MCKSKKNFGNIVIFLKNYIFYGIITIQFPQVLRIIWHTASLCY